MISNIEELERDSLWKDKARYRAKMHALVRQAARPLRISGIRSIIRLSQARRSMAIKRARARAGFPTRWDTAIDDLLAKGVHDFPDFEPYPEFWGEELLNDRQSR